MRSDPGLLRLRMASQTVLSLALALGTLYLLTKATGEPLTVALLGVVIAMMSAMVVNDPDPRQQKITMALLPVPAAVAVSLGALLATDRVVGDVVFVAIIFAAVYARRFAARGMALGMVAFMTYFFALFLGATVDQLPWLIGTVFVGTACSFVMNSYVFPDRPDRLLRRTLQVMRARIDAVVDAAADGLEAGQLDDSLRRRLRAVTTRLNQTALMVQSQLEDKVDVHPIWPGIDEDELELRLFDVELAAEQLARAGGRAAAAAGTLPTTVRTELVGALDALRASMRGDAPAGMLDRAERRAGELRAERPGTTGDGKATGVEAYQLVLAIVEMAVTTGRTRDLIDRAVDPPEPTPSSPADEQPPAGEQPGPEQEPSAQEQPAPEEQSTDEVQRASWTARLRPSTRQAIQVAVAASLAIIAGELLSPARWYWAVIAAFVIFSGTTSRGETLTKGWQRLLGTAAGVPAGVLIATAVGGDAAWSLALIFVCMFCGFYLLQVAYSLMIFWITTMLALLYGLLGQFSIGLLLLRLEETAIGAAIGVLVAILVLPTSTRATIRDGARDFLTSLGDLVDAAARTLSDRPAPADLTEKARALDQQLQQLRETAKPLTDGIAGIGGRGDARRAVRVLTACDHYARTLARLSGPTEPVTDPQWRTGVETAAARVRHNIDALADLVSEPSPKRIEAATEPLDTVEAATRNGDDDRSSADRRRLMAALHALRRIDQSVVALAGDLGAETTTDTQ